MLNILVNFFLDNKVNLYIKKQLMYSCKWFYLTFLWLHENNKVKQVEPPAILNRMIFKIVRFFLFLVFEIIRMSIVYLFWFVTFLTA